MTGCSQAGCIQTDLKAYKRYIGHGVTILCGILRLGPPGDRHEPDAG